MRTFSYAFSLAISGLLATAGCHHQAASTTPAPQPDFKAQQPRAMAERVPASPGSNGVRPAGWVFFSSDSSNLTPAANEDLDAVVQWLKDHPEGQIVVEGHADASGPAEHNLELSFKRGAAVEDYLAAHGVPRDRMSITPEGAKDASPRVLDGDRRVIVFSTMP